MISHLNSTLQLFLHTDAFCNLRHLCIIQPCIAMYARVRQIPIHTVDLGQILAAALRTYIHLQLLMTTVITVCQGQINALVKAISIARLTSVLIAEIL